MTLAPRARDHSTPLPLFDDLGLCHRLLPAPRHRLLALERGSYSVCEAPKGPRMRPLRVGDQERAVVLCDLGDGRVERQLG